MDCATARPRCERRRECAGLDRGARRLDEARCNTDLTPEGVGDRRAGHDSRLPEEATTMRTPEQIEAMVPVSDRSAQRFPQLGAAQLELVRRFAKSEARKFSAGETIYRIGDRDVP